MLENQAAKDTCRDSQLITAVAASRSWRGVMRELGLAEASPHAIQIITFSGKQGWVAQVGRRPYSAGKQARLIPYDSKSLDFFFTLDGDLNTYLIPSQVISGQVTIVLRSYSGYIVGSAAGLWGDLDHSSAKDLQLLSPRECAE